MNKRTITLGGVQYEINELPARKNAAWRQHLETQLGPLLGILEQAGAGLKLENTEDLMRVINQVGRLLVTAPDHLIELLFAYAPNLAAERDLILDSAYDSELITAFTTVLGLAYPFDGLARLASLASGSTPKPSVMTSTNSPLPNGATSVKTSTTWVG